MPPRASSLAEICFGPVPIFVKLYSVASERSVGLFQVHAHCGARVEQQHFCPADEVVVPRAAIAKEYRFADGTVTALSEEEIKSAESDRVGTVEILECIPEASIDPIYLGKAMLVGPNEDHGIDAYSTFVDALAETRTAAVGMHYGRTRDQLVVIERYRTRGLLLRELFYESELKAIDEIELPLTVRASLPPGAFELWTAEVERCRKPAFSSGAYKDGYPERLLRAAERNVKPQETPPAASLLRAARERVSRAPAQVASSDRSEPAPLRPR
jgi:DNA end-binding protein Ku